MRVLFIAQHGSGDQDPEGAVSYALRTLGHEVVEVGENTYPYATGEGCDFALIFKYPNLCGLNALKCPMVFWYFDRVDSGDDPKLAARNLDRIEWMQTHAPRCLVGFCTDGDWVERWNREHPEDTSPRLIHLMQGVDERYTGPGQASQSPIGPSEILFVGGATLGNGLHGKRRLYWHNFMLWTYGDKYRVVGDGNYRNRVVKRDLANLIAGAKIVVAPQGVESNRYWSNRVYLTCGFQGLMIHPCCMKLHEHYDSTEEILFYRSKEELKDLIDYYLDDARVGERLRIARAGYERTIAEHLYRHRCEAIIEEVKRRL